MADDAKDLEKFLSEVDNIQSLIKDLTNEGSTDSIKKADDYLEKMGIDAEKKKKKKKYPAQDNTGVNRTVINHAAFKDEPQQPPGPNFDGNTDPEAFMRVMEVDAQDRAERRKKQRAEATIIKEEGNVAFKAGDYEKAVEMYTKALGVVKDLTAVWTNRAQAYIKLGRYDEALSDCDWALRVDEKCLKAYVHRGRAYLLQDKYDDAIAAYEEAKTIDPSKTKAMTGYIEEVHRTQATKAQESAAQSFLASGEQGPALGIVELLKRVNKADQRAMYYAGGLRFITEALVDDTARTLFRTEGGLELTQKHTYLAKCWTAALGGVTQEEADMLGTVMEVYTAAIKDNDENQRCLLTQEGFVSHLLRWLESTKKRHQVLRASGGKLIYDLSLEEFGQKLILENTDLEKFVEVCFKTAKTEGRADIHGICCITNLSRHAKFRSKIWPSIEEQVLLPCENILGDSKTQLAVLVFVFDALTNLCPDKAIRVKIARRPTLWRLCANLIKKYEFQLKPGSLVEDMLHALLGNATRLTPDLNTQREIQEALTDSTETLVNASVRLSTCGHSKVETRAVGLLSHLLPPGGEAVKCACEAKAVPMLIGKIQEESDPVVLKAAAKALTACTQHQPDVRSSLLEVKKGLSALVSLLKDDDETLVGNAALCLGHLAGEEKVSARLVKTNIVQHLLVKARDGRNPQLQHNCAILLAKLAQYDQRHLERLRELHGLEILVDVMRHVKT